MLVGCGTAEGRRWSLAPATEKRVANLRCHARGQGCEKFGRSCCILVGRSVSPNFSSSLQQRLVLLLESNLRFTGSSMHGCWLRGNGFVRACKRMEFTTRGRPAEDEQLVRYCCTSCCDLLAFSHRALSNFTRSLSPEKNKCLAALSDWFLRPLPSKSTCFCLVSNRNPQFQQLSIGKNGYACSSISQAMKWGVF